MPPVELTALPSLAIDATLDPQVKSSTPLVEPLDVEVTQLSPFGFAKDDHDQLFEKEESVKDEEDGEVEESVVGEVEEEWPSLGLELLEKEESVKDGEDGEVEESVVGEVEEERPSMKSIPGMKSAKPEMRTEKAQSKSESISKADESSASSSLGELRFKDE